MTETKIRDDAADQANCRKTHKESFKEINETHEIDVDHPIHSPVLSVRHIAGLADYVDGHTIIDIKTTNCITQHHLMQVLAYHHLSTKRSDLRIDRVIVYDAVSGRDVSIDLSGHEYGYDLPDWSLYDNEEVSEGL